MWILKRLFGRRPNPAPKDGSVDLSAVADVIAAIKAQAQPCVRLGAGGAGNSRLGGVPEMVAAWPRYKGNALCCVAQLHLAEVRAAGGPDWLPDVGNLVFFYDLEKWSWGFDAQDAGSFVVIHETAAAPVAAEPDDLSEDAKFPPYPVSFIRAMSFPGERFPIDWRRFNATSEEALWTALQALDPPAPAHQIGGYPSTVQSDDMEAQCQRLAPGGRVEDWRLLLQLDTDDEAGMMWGDVGTLYFWIREPDARAGDFSKVWMILQCN